MMRFRWVILLTAMMLGETIKAAPLDLWPVPAPGVLGDKPEDIPSLTAYLPAPEARIGTSMLIVPGGGYWSLSGHEGKGYAEWLVSRGISCYVLKYRLGSRGYRHPRMLEDVTRALRMVRAFARRDGLDPARIGIIGSSAGGHLASTLLTHFDAGQSDSVDPIERESSRPDFGILCYPVISGVSFAHQGSFINLLGANPSEEILRYLSNELHVTKDTPPCFIWHAIDDDVVPVENSLIFASALRRAGVPFSLHIYEKGGHGLGLPLNNNAAPPWDAECLHWLGGRGLLVK